MKGGLFPCIARFSGDFHFHSLRIINISLIVCVLSTLAGLSSMTYAFENYEFARRRALESARADKHEEAYAAFLELSESAENDYQVADALEQAAMSALHLERTDEALELAGRIALEPQANTVRMRLMAELDMWEQIIDEFKDVDFEQWPGTIAGEAFYLRGQAYLEKGEKHAAEKDMIRAARRTERPGIFFDLGNLARSLGNDVVAMDAYMKMQRATPSKSGWRYYSSILSRAEILMRNGIYEYALEELEKMPETLTGYWQVQRLGRRAAILVEMERETKAIKVYRDALEEEGIMEVQKRRIKAALNELEKQE